jgi:hypothetical protein
MVPMWSRHPVKNQKTENKSLIIQNRNDIDFNPDLKHAFPTEGAPQPFLADFSKFQR